MRLTVGNKNLKKALGLTEKVVSRNSSLPILGNILIKTENGRLKCVGTNLEIGISCLVGAKIDEVGEIAIPARIISDFVSNIEDDKITLSTKNSTLIINSENYKTQILGFDTKDFPIIPKIKTLDSVKIDPFVLRNSLTSVFDSIAASEARPELAGVLVKINTHKIILASTDSFRLSEKIIETKGLPLSFILPRATVSELIRVCSESEGEIELKVSDSQASFSNGDFEMVSRLVDGNYPDYQKVIPESYLSRSLIKKSDLEKNLRLAGLFSSAISDVKVICGKEETLVVAKNSEKGEIEARCRSILKNEPFEVSLNFRYLLDGLKNIGSGEVALEWTGAGSPLVLRSGDDKKDFTYLIMPLRR